MNGTGWYRRQVMVPDGTVARGKMNDAADEDGRSRKERIMAAAMPLFLQRGYAATSTLAIASAARLSKRDLYAEFAGKRDIFAACIADRAQAMRAPLQWPAPRTALELRTLLIRYGVGVRMGLADPKVIATYRIAVQEAPTEPEFARTLHEDGRIAAYNAMTAMLAAAQARGLLGEGAPEMMARLYLSILVADVKLQHLLCMAPLETEALATEHAEVATGALFRMYGADR